jgi:hypothetical protein
VLELLCNTNRQLLPKQNQLVRSHVFLNKPLLCCYHRCPAAHLVCLTSKQRLAEHWVQRELSHAAAKLGELSTVVQRAQRIQLLMTGSARGGVGNSGRVVVAVVVGARLSVSKDAMANMSRGAQVCVCTIQEVWCVGAALCTCVWGSLHLQPHPPVQVPGAAPQLAVGP